MQRITTQNPWSYMHFWNEPGTYILENTAAAACLGQSPNATVTTVDPDALERRFSPITVPDGEFSILIVRPGAFGDLLMLTPTIRAIREQYPMAVVTVCCAEAYMGSLQRVTKLVKYPITVDKINEYDAVIWLEDAIENNVEAAEYSGVMCLARESGIKLTAGTHLDFELAEEEVQEVLDQAPKEATKSRVVIQCRASDFTRSYDTEHWMEVVHQLWKKNCEIFLVGAPGEITGFVGDVAVKDVHNMTQVPLSFRQSAALLSTADLAITVDSSMMHVAGALKVPCISLHGPVSADLRTKELGNNHPITGDCSKCEIAPCAYLPKGGIAFPPGQVCEKERKCVVLDSIAPSVIVAKAIKMLGIGHKKRKGAK